MTNLLLNKEKMIFYCFPRFSTYKHLHFVAFWNFFLLFPFGFFPFLVERVDLENLQLVGVISMLIGAKRKEIHTPVVGDMVYTAGDTYTDKQICDMEKAILHKLDNRLNKPYADQISASIILIIQF